MSLLREIQNDCTSQGVPLSVVLRKCLILSKRLQHEPMGRWVEQELNGYQAEADLPPYRKTRAEVYGDFLGPFGMQQRNLSIPSVAVKEEHREVLFTIKFMEGVAHYEGLLASERETQFQVPWPADFLAYYSEKIGRGYVCMSAWRIVTRGELEGLLDQIRNRVLSFVLSVEAENPEAGEAMLGGEPPIPSPKVQQIFNTYIYGGTNVVASGSQGQISDFEQNVGTWEDLTAALRELGLQDTDIAGLADAIQADVTSASIPGPAVVGWLDSITTKITSGAINIANSTAGALIASLVLQHLTSAAK